MSFNRKKKRLIFFFLFCPERLILISEYRRMNLVQGRRFLLRNPFRGLNPRILATFKNRMTERENTDRVAEKVLMSLCLKENLKKKVVTKTLMDIVIIQIITEAMKL